MLSTCDEHPTLFESEEMRLERIRREAEKDCCLVMGEN